MKLTIEEKQKIQKLYNMKIQFICYDIGAPSVKNGKKLNSKRNYCKIFFDDPLNGKQIGLGIQKLTPIKRQLGAWRLECILGRKLKTIRTGEGFESVDHIDGDSENDFHENLQVLNMVDNAKKDYNNIDNSGENSGHAKVNNEIVKKILELYFYNKLNIPDILNYFNYEYSRDLIKPIIERKNWKCINFNIPQFFTNKKLFLLLSKKKNYKCTLFNNEIIFLYEGEILFIDNDRYKFIGKNKNFPNRLNCLYINESNKLIKRSLIKKG